MSNWKVPLDDKGNVIHMVPRWDKPDTEVDNFTFVERLIIDHTELWSSSSHIVWLAKDGKKYHSTLDLLIRALHEQTKLKVELQPFFYIEGEFTFDKRGTKIFLIDVK